MLPLLVLLCALLSKGLAETLWFPVPLLTNYEFSRTGGEPTNGLTMYVATAPNFPATTSRFILPGDKIFLAEGSGIAVARVPVLSKNVDYSCSIGSDNRAQCVRTLIPEDQPPNVYSWTTSVCAATTLPPPTPLATGDIMQTNIVTASKGPPWLPCSTSNDPSPTYSSVMLQWFIFALVGGIFILPGFLLLGVSYMPRWHARKIDLIPWEPPSIERSQIPVTDLSRYISPLVRDGREIESQGKDSSDIVIPSGQSPSNGMASPPASNLQTSPNASLGTSPLASIDVEEPPEPPIFSVETDFLVPRTTSVSAFCAQVMSSSVAADITIEGIETRLSRMPFRKQNFLLLRIRHGSRWAYLRMDMMGSLCSSSTLSAFEMLFRKVEGPTIRIFDNQTPEASKLLLEEEMSTATFYATRWMVEYPGFDPTDISELQILKSKNPAHHYQLLEIGPENLTSSKTPTLQDFARVLQLLEEEVAPISRHPILRYPVPEHAALLWTIIPRTALLAAYRPQWIIYHHLLSVENLPHVPFLLGAIAAFVTILPFILFVIFFFKGELFESPFVFTATLSGLPFASRLVLKVLIVDVMIGRWRRQWDTRAGILLSRILERIDSHTLEESTMSRTEAIDLYHPHVTEQQRMHIFRLEPIPTSPTTHNLSRLGMGLSLSSKIILEPVPVSEFFPEDVLEPRQTTLRQFCADLRVDRRGSDALIEAVSWRKSRKQPFLHEFILLLVRHGVQYYTVRIDRRGKLNKALDGLLLSGNAMEVVTIDHWQQRNYRARDLFNEHGKSDPVATLVSWHFDLPWLTNPGDPELAALAVQQSGSAVQELFKLGSATQLTASRRPRLGDLIVLWETMGREAPRYCLPSYNCYWQSRIMTLLIARRFPREFILRERSIPVTYIRELHTRSFVAGDFFKHWRPWYSVVGWMLVANASGAAWVTIASPVTALSDAYILGDQLYNLHYPGHPSFQDLKHQWISDLGRIFGAMTASVILTLGPIFFMGWNMNRATERIWNQVRQTDEVSRVELAELDGGDGTSGPWDPDLRLKRQALLAQKIRRMFRMISIITGAVLVMRSTADHLLTDGRKKIENSLIEALQQMEEPSGYGK